MKVTEVHMEAQENKDIVAEIKQILGKERDRKNEC